MHVLSQQVLSSLRVLEVTGGDRLFGSGEEAPAPRGRAGGQQAAQGARAEPRLPCAAPPSHLGAGAQPSAGCCTSGAGCTARLRSDPDRGLLTAPFSPVLLLSVCASPRPWLTQLQMNRQGEPGSNPGPLCCPLGGTDTAALDQDSSEARAALAISRERLAGSRHSHLLAA